MNTLIELYDERAIENILAPDMFRPQRIVYLCPGEIAQDRTRQETLAAFFQRRGWEPELIFVETSRFKADRILRQLFTIGEKYPDCAIDVTGGSDAALFAAGMFAAKEGVPAFTYSRKKNRFYDISGAAFADELPCGLTYSIEDFFLMAGGTLLPGRVDNQILSQYLSDFDPFFDCFLQFRRDWPNIISYIQRISPSEYGQIPPLSVVGSALELYAYKACVDSAIFHDVISSAVVRWDEVLGHGSVSNEIDVMAARGVIPLFLSCKACDIKTEALNELAILRDRFGGKGAKAAIVTTEVCNAAARHRAAQLGIAVIDLEELKTGQLVHRLKVIMKAE